MKFTTECAQSGAFVKPVHATVMMQVMTGVNGSGLVGKWGKVAMTLTPPFLVKSADGNWHHRKIGYESNEDRTKIKYESNVNRMKIGYKSNQNRITTETPIEPQLK